MAIDFPNTPTNGQTFTVGSVTWIYVSATTSWNVYNSTIFATDSLVVHLAGTETITGTKTFTAAPAVSISGSTSYFSIRGQSGYDKILYFTNTSAAARWAMITNATAESGSDVGSDFVIGRYNDAGTFVGAPMQITRSTGAIQFSGGAAASVPVAVRGFAGQTANLQEWQDSAYLTYASITPMGVATINNTMFGWSQIFTNIASTTYYKIATLPISSGGTFDHIVIDAVLDPNWGSAAKVYTRILLSNRNAFTYRWWLYGTDVGANAARVAAYVEGDGSISVYAVGMASTFSTISLNVSLSLRQSAGAGPTLYSNPTGSTSAPTGTIGFSTHDITTYVPRSYFPYAASPQFNGSVMATDSAVVHIAGTETITGAKTFTANPIVRSTSTIPSIDVQSIQATGYTPAFVNMVRQGAASAATPDSVAIGELRYSGLTTTSAYFMAASINVNSGVNTAAGAPSDMTFLTHNGTTTFERLRITSAGGFEFKNATVGGGGAAAVKINDTSGAGAIMILRDASGTNNRYEFWDGTYSMITEGGSVKQAFYDYDSSSQADSLYTYRASGSAASPANLAIGADLHFTYHLGYVTGSNQYMGYERWRQDGSNPTSANAVQGAATRDGAWQIGLGNNDWGASYENITMLSQGDITFAGSGMDGYAHKLWNDPRARVTVIGISDHWSDLTITGDVSGDVLNVTVAGARNITLGMRLWSTSGTLISPGVYISALGTGTGGTGTYTLSTNLGTIASQSLRLEERPSYAPTFRIRDAETAPTVGKNFGTIEFWSDWTSGDGKGVKGFIASKIKSTGASDMVFGTASTTQNAIERMRLDSAGTLTISNPGVLTYWQLYSDGTTNRYSTSSILDITDHFSTSGIARRWFASNSNTVGTRTAFATNSIIFKDDYYGVTTSNSSSLAASVQIRADGSATSSIAPGSIWITTTGDDSSGWYRFRLNKNGLLSLGQDVESRAPMAAYPARLELQGRGDWVTLNSTSIAATVMTVTTTTGGAIYVGAQVWGPGVTPGTYVISFGTGTGAAGTYNLNVSQTVASTTLYADGSYNENNVLRFRNANTTTAAARQPLGGMEWYTADSTGAGIKAYIKAMSATATGDDATISIGTAASGGQLTERLVVDATGIYTTTADTATTATHYYVETATDGYIRPKTLANVRTEIVTTAAANAAAITTTGTVTSGTWSASFGAVSGANLTSLTAGNLSGTITPAVLGNSTVFIGTTGVLLNRGTGALTLAGITLTTPTITDFTNATHTHAAAASGGTLSGYATDSLVVHLAGTESITGQKTFTSASTYFGSASNQFLVLQGGAGNHAIEIGRTDSVGSTPVIDFHSGTTGGNDYDARILASGGGVASGQGSITVTARTWTLTSADSGWPWNVIANTNTNTDSGYLVLRKAPSDNSIGLGDRIGTILWQGLDTSGGIRDGAYILSSAAGANTATYVPSNLSLWVVSSAGVSQQALILNADMSATFSHDIVLGAVGKRLYLSPAGVSLLESSGRVYTAAGITTDGTISATGLAGSLLSSATPTALGTAAPGNSAIPARDNHVHPKGGGAVGGGTDAVFYENDTTVTTNYTITSGKNAMSAGPITVNSGITVTVPSGSTWTVV